MLPTATALVLLVLALALQAEAGQNETPDWACATHTRNINMCNAQDMCMACISDGCAFNIMTRRCRSQSMVSVNGTSDESSSGSATDSLYCASDDQECASCSNTDRSSSTLCEGTNGCICPSVCDVMASIQSSCVSQKLAMYLYLGVAFLLLLVPWSIYLLQRFRNRDTGRLPMVVTRPRPNRRRAPAPPRDESRMLQLAAWRSHCEENKVDVNDLELKSCYLLMHDDKERPVEVRSLNTDVFERDQREPSSVAPRSASLVAEEQKSEEEADIASTTTSAPSAPSAQLTTTALPVPTPPPSPQSAPSLDGTRTSPTPSSVL